MRKIKVGGALKSIERGINKGGETKKGKKIEGGHEKQHSDIISIILFLVCTHFYSNPDLTRLILLS